MSETPTETVDQTQPDETSEPQDEQLDLERAMRTIRSLRAEAKAARQQLRRVGLSRSYLIGTIVEEWLARSTQ